MLITLNTGHHIPVREADGWRPRRPQALLRPRLGPGLAAEARAAGEPPPAAGTVQYSVVQYSAVQYSTVHYEPPCPAAGLLPAAGPGPARRLQRGPQPLHGGAGQVSHNPV